MIQFGIDVYKVILAPNTAADESGVDEEDDEVGNEEEEDDQVSKEEEEKVSTDVGKELYLVGHKGKCAVGGIVQDRELVECLSSLFDGSCFRVLGLEDFETGFLKKVQSNDEGPAAEATSETRATVKTLSPENKMMQVIQDYIDSGDLDSFRGSKLEVGVIELSKIQGIKELEEKASKKSNVNKAGKETGVVKELKAAEESDSGKKAISTRKSDAKQESKATEETESRKKVKANEESESRKKVKANEESDSIQKPKATEESESRKRAKASGKSDAKQDSKATEGTESRKYAESTKESDSRKKVKATEESRCRKKAKATEESRSRKKAKATKGTDSQEAKESSRPGRKNVRTCMTCGLQEPAPKVFKKCKRCKDEDCLNPPYYCGRVCQVLDWTGRHRQEHEKNCAGGPATS